MGEQGNTGGLVEKKVQNQVNTLLFLHNQINLGYFNILCMCEQGFDKLREGSVAAGLQFSRSPQECLVLRFLKP